MRVLSCDHRLALSTTSPVEWGLALLDRMAHGRRFDGSRVLGDHP